MQAALKGSEQIGFTIISLTVSLIAVLIPLLFMGDVVGRLFHEFAITLAVTIVISAIVSLTLVPMMCARLVRHRPDAQRTRFDLAAERGFNWIIGRYDCGLNVVLDHQTLTLLVALLTLVATVWLYIIVPKGFFPVQDTGVLQGISVAAETASFGAMAQHQQALADAILKDPDVVSLSSFIGVDGTNMTLNTGRFLINLKPKDDRALSATQIAQRLQQETANVPGVQLYLQPVQDLTLDASVSRTQYQFVLENPNLSAFNEWVPKLLAQMQKSPDLTDVASDLEQQALDVDLVINRQSAARYGITPATVDNALYDMFGQRIISTIYTQSNQYRVIMEAEPSLQTSLNALNTIYLPSSASTTGQVPLSAIVAVEQKPGPLMISHLGQFPATTISFDTPPDSSLGAAVTAIRQAEKDIHLPNSFITALQGAAAALEASLSNELFLVLAAILTVYIVLGVLYESFIHPITILSTLPSAGAGALVALLIAGDNIDVISIIGIILLIGIVKKNGIMMVDFALQAEREEGKPPREAIHQACLLRFRPILMTTMAALLAALPLMLGNGTGSELRRPLGVAMAGGLIVSQVLTLFTTPAIYLMFDKLAWRLSGKGLAGGSASAGKARREWAGSHLFLLLRREAQGRRRGCAHRGQCPLTLRPQARHDGCSGSLSHEHLRSLYRAAGRDYAADHRHRPGRRVRLLQAAGLAAAAGRFPDHLGAGDAARCQPRDRRDQRRRAAGAPSRPDRRRDGNDLLQFGRAVPHRAAVRPRPGHQRRRARCAGGDQCRTRRSADQPAQQPDLPQGEPGRCADPDPGADVALP